MKRYYGIYIKRGGNISVLGTGCHNEHRNTVVQNQGHDNYKDAFYDNLDDLMDQYLSLDHKQNNYIVRDITDEIEDVEITVVQNFSKARWLKL